MPLVLSERELLFSPIPELQKGGGGGGVQVQFNFLSLVGVTRRGGGESTSTIHWWKSLDTWLGWAID